MPLSWSKYQATGKFISAAILVTSSFAAQAEPVFPAVVQICGEEYANAQLYADAFETIGWQVIDGIEVPEAAIQALGVGLLTGSVVPNATPEEWKIAYSRIEQIFEFAQSEQASNSIFFQRETGDQKRILLLEFSDREFLFVGCSVVSDFDDERDWIFASEMQPIIRPTQNSSTTSKPVSTSYMLDLDNIESVRGVRAGSVVQFDPAFFNQNLELAISTDTFLTTFLKKFNK